jgi:transposase-like protein
MKARRTFSEDFKKTVIQRLLEPDSPGPSKIAEEFGIYDSTLYNWKQKYAKSLIMKKSNNSKNWSPEKMLEAIIETASMDEQELGEYLRSNGLHSSDLEAFKNEFIKA